MPQSDGESRSRCFGVFDECERAINRYGKFMPTLAGYWGQSIVVKSCPVWVRQILLPVPVARCSYILSLGASPGKTGVLHNIRTATFAAWPCLSQKSSFFERDSGRQFPYQLTHKRRVAGTHPLAAEAGYRSVGGTSLTLAQREAMSALAYLRCTRLVEGGCLARETPGRHSPCGRIGRFSKPPPQLGQTSCKCTLTQAAQNVHS